MSETYGYAICNPNEKCQDIDRLKGKLIKCGLNDDNIFLEYENEKRNNRTQLNSLMNIVEAGDTITTTEVGRLAVSTQNICEIIKEIQDKQLQLIILNGICLDCRQGNETNMMTKGMLQMCGVFAEMEHDIISQRVKSGIIKAKAKGNKVGRPSTTSKDVPSDFYKYYTHYQKKELSIAEIARLGSCSRTTVYKYIKLIEECDK